MPSVTNVNHINIRSRVWQLHEIGIRHIAEDYEWGL